MKHIVIVLAALLFSTQAHAWSFFPAKDCKMLQDQIHFAYSYADTEWKAKGDGKALMPQLAFNLKSEKVEAVLEHAARLSAIYTAGCKD
jgi:hypothetical protein